MRTKMTIIGTLRAFGTLVLKAWVPALIIGAFTLLTPYVQKKFLEQENLNKKRLALEEDFTQNFDKLRFTVNDLLLECADKTADQTSLTVRQLLRQKEKQLYQLIDAAYAVPVFFPQATVKRFQGLVRWFQTVTTAKDFCEPEIGRKLQREQYAIAKLMWREIYGNKIPLRS